MAAVVVALDGVTRHDDADSNTNWSNLGGGGPAPASEPQLRYQYSGTGTVGAVNRKVTSTTSRTGIQAEGGTARDLATAGTNYALAILKGYVADFGDLNATYGVEMRIGSAAADHYHYNVAGSGANGPPFDDGYPARGGYLIVAIDPNIAGWREGTAGTPALGSVDYFALAAQFIAGGAKSENVAMDAIDVITDRAPGSGGLKITRGDSTDADGVFQDLATWDEATISRRYGLAINVGSIIVLRAWHTIGESGTATAFTDNDAVVVFPDGYHSTGSFGINCNIENSGTVITIGALIIGEGLKNSGVSGNADTRPDFLVTGTAGTMNLTGTLQNHRNVTLTSGADVDGATIECELLTQASADIANAVILTNQVTQVACLQDPTFGTTTDLHDTEFIQAGVGHAIEIDTTGTYSFTGLGFTGYGGTAGSNPTPSSGANDAAILNSSGGLVTINVTGGDTPSVRNTAGSTTVVNNTVTIAVTGVIPGSSVAIYDSSSVELLNKPAVPTTNFGYVTLPGTNEYVDTLESVQMVAGDLEIIAYLRLTDWTPGTNEPICNQWGSANADKSFFFEVAGAISGDLQLRVQTTSGTFTQYQSSVATGITDATYGWVRALYDHGTGNVNFYTSTDPVDTHPTEVSWTQLGTQQTGTARAMGGLDPIDIGGRGLSTIYSDGRIAFVGIWNDGAKLIEADWRIGPDFDASDERPDEWAPVTWKLRGTAPTYTEAAATLLTVSGTYGYTADEAVTIVVRKGSNTPKYFPISTPGLITAAGMSVPVEQTFDPFA